MARPTINVGDSRLTMEVKVIGVRRLTLRLRLAMGILKLARFVGGLEVRINVETPPAKAPPD